MQDESAIQYVMEDKGVFGTISNRNAINTYALVKLVLLFLTDD